MKKQDTFSFLAIIIFILSLVFPVGNLLYADEPQAQQEQPEKWFEQKGEKPTKAEEVLKEEPAPEPKAKKKRWRVFGKVGYEYDDNVRLKSNKEGGDLRFVSGDQNAGRYEISSGFGYKLITNDRYEAEVVYAFSQSFHDDSLNEFNFREHAVTLYGRRFMRLWDRPSRLTAYYRFSHGSLHDRTFSSFNTWGIAWDAAWKENLPITVYQKMVHRNFRNKGFNPPDTERDGLYNYTGVLQRYLFDNRKREISFGYEFGFQATEGNNFDNISNGIRAGFKTPVVEKVKFENNFYFEVANFHHSSGSPNRNDLRYNYEVILSRPLGKYFELGAFYKWSYVNTLNDGTWGRFNYYRNIYGAELKFSY